MQAKSRARREGKYEKAAQIKINENNSQPEQRARRRRLRPHYSFSEWEERVGFIHRALDDWNDILDVRSINQYTFSPVSRRFQRFSLRRLSYFLLSLLSFWLSISYSWCRLSSRHAWRRIFDCRSDGELRAGAAERWVKRLHCINFRSRLLFTVLLWPFHGTCAAVCASACVWDKLWFIFSFCPSLLAMKWIITSSLFTQRLHRSYRTLMWVATMVLAPTAAIAII